MCQYPERVWILYMLGTKQTQIILMFFLEIPKSLCFCQVSWYFFISAMNTQWHHFLQILDQRQNYLPSYLFLQTTSHSQISPPFLSSQCVPFCLLRVPRLENHPLLIQSEGLFLVTIVAMSSEGGHLFTLADVSVSLLVKISKLAPVTGLESTPFDSSSWVDLVPESPLGLARWFHRLFRIYLIRALIFGHCASSVPVSGQLIPLQPHTANGL